MVGELSPLYLVIDQGGHASRALVFDEGVGIVSSHAVQIATHRYEGDRVEHDPDELSASVSTAISCVLRELGERAGQIVAAALATQRSSIVCWDKTSGLPLSPVLSWQDRRTNHDLGRYAPYREQIHTLTGLVLSPHYGATKLRWCLDNLPEVRSALQKHRLACGPLSSYLLFKLLDEKPLVVDPANASRTLLWNYAELGWDPLLLRWFDIPQAILPRCVPNRHDFGNLSTGGFKIPMQVVTGDQSAALFALGAPHPATTYINIGTGAFLQRVSGNSPTVSDSLLNSVVWQSGTDVTYVLEGTVNGAGSALQKLADEQGVTVESLYEPVAAGLRAVSEPPLFLNGISGLGSPFWVADYPSRFIGHGDLVARLVAVIESIVFLLVTNLEQMSALSGPAEQLIVTGGMSVLDSLCQRLADLSATPVYRPRLEEATARGAACLLMKPSGQLPEVERDRFDAAANPGLQHRYRRWHDELNNSLSKSV